MSSFKRDKKEEEDGELYYWLAVINFFLSR